MQAVKLVRHGDGRAATKTIDCTSQLEIVSAKSWQHPVDGSTVPAEDVLTHRGLDLGLASKFSGVPPAFVLPGDRADTLRGGAGLRGPFPCLTLLKFVPRTSLTLYHQVCLLLP